LLSVPRFFFLSFEEKSVDKLSHSYSGCDDYCTHSFLHIRMCDSQGTDRSSMKVRLDKLIAARGLAASRERAQALILAGRVLVNHQKIEKPGTAVSEDVEIRMLGEDLRYVSRGGLKLERALQYWNIDLQGRTCLDIGASTGGFTDCMLQHGATHVVAIDTGYGQIDAELRRDPRVELLEKTNARYLKSEELSRAADFFAIDVSFISVTLVLPAVIGALRAKSAENPESVILVKPQFEVGRELVGKGGIVRDQEAQLRTVGRVRSTVEELGGRDVDFIESPILGAEGNREFLLHSRFA
jgi:23S rRNA (cytidine1920-2'-O)/16S rRNA (cytidine1409-2'-O)-methyltransferase